MARTGAPDHFDLWWVRHTRAGADRRVAHRQILDRGDHARGQQGRERARGGWRRGALSGGEEDGSRLEARLVSRGKHWAASASGALTRRSLDQEAVSPDGLPLSASQRQKERERETDAALRTLECIQDGQSEYACSRSNALNLMSVQGGFFYIV